MSHNHCPKCGNPLSQIGNVDVCIDCDDRIELPLASDGPNLKPCPACGEMPAVSSELTVCQCAACANPSCMMFGVGFTLAMWNLPRQTEEKFRAELEAQEGITTILELFRDDAKSAAEEAVELLDEIIFHEKVPSRWKRVTDALRKIVSREEK